MSSPAPTPASSPSTSIAPATEAAFAASLHAADAAETIAPVSRSRICSGHSSYGTTREPSAANEHRSDRMWQAADLASGTIGNERAARSRAGHVRGGLPPAGRGVRPRAPRPLPLGVGPTRGRPRPVRAGSLDAFGQTVDRLAAAYAGLAQAELLADHYAEAERCVTRVFDLVATPDAGRAEWVMARRVLGVLRSQLGDPEGGAALCQESFAEAPNAKLAPLASLYLCTVLLDAAKESRGHQRRARRSRGRPPHRVDHSYGGYLDALAAKGPWPWSLVRSRGRTRAPRGHSTRCRRRVQVAARVAAPGRSSRRRARARGFRRTHSPAHRRMARDRARRRGRRVHLALGEWERCHRGRTRLGRNDRHHGVVGRSVRDAHHRGGHRDRARPTCATRTRPHAPEIVAHLQRRLDAVTAAASEAGRRVPVGTAAARPRGGDPHEAHDTRSRCVGRSGAALERVR